MIGDDQVSARTHPGADPRVPAKGRGAGRAPPAREVFASARGVGGTAGQHAPSRTPVDPRARRGDRAIHLGRPIAGSARGEAFARSAGVGPRHGVAAFDALGRTLTPVRTPFDDAWILLRDEPTLRADQGPVPTARLLPSGDPYLLLQGADRELVVPNADRRRALWTPRVWPGGLLVNGEIVGTWRRADTVLTVQPWRRLSRVVRDAVAAEAESLPLPGLG